MLSIILFLECFKYLFYQLPCKGWWKSKMLSFIWKLHLLCIRVVLCFFQVWLANSSRLKAAEHKTYFPAGKQTFECCYRNWGNWEFVLKEFHKSLPPSSGSHVECGPPHRLTPSVTKPIIVEHVSAAPMLCEWKFHQLLEVVLWPSLSTVAHDERWPHSGVARKHPWKHLKSEFIWLEICKRKSNHYYLRALFEFPSRNRHNKALVEL